MEATINNSSYIEEIERMAARKGISVTRFLGLVGVDYSHFSKWKRGEVRPRLSTIQGIRESAKRIQKQG